MQNIQHILADFGKNSKESSNIKRDRVAMIDFVDNQFERAVCGIRSLINHKKIKELARVTFLSFILSVLFKFKSS
ncbi:hypothetical protein OIU84_024643 [Salix udensis]|uniref:Uncharacterized protein n=1 Tax=Salix udensis TaxID=889485 RepID=A0AAD6KI81_9ROSI|nr:hypothetical protein OIU84_024643 [Salix udensis]